MQVLVRNTQYGTQCRMRGLPQHAQHAQRAQQAAHLNSADDSTQPFSSLKAFISARSPSNSSPCSSRSAALSSSGSCRQAGGQGRVPVGPGCWDACIVQPQDSHSQAHYTHSLTEIQTGTQLLRSTELTAPQHQTTNQKP